MNDQIRAHSNTNYFSRQELSDTNFSNQRIRQQIVQEKKSQKNLCYPEHLARISDMSQHYTELKRAAIMRKRPQTVAGRRQRASKANMAYMKNKNQTIQAARESERPSSTQSNTLEQRLAQQLHDDSDNYTFSVKNVSILTGGHRHTNQSSGRMAVTGRLGSAARRRSRQQQLRVNSGKPKTHNIEHAAGVDTEHNKIEKEILGTSSRADLTTAQGLFGETTRDLTNTGRYVDDDELKLDAKNDAADDAPLWYPQRTMVY